MLERLASADPSPPAVASPDVAGVSVEGRGDLSGNPLPVSARFFKRTLDIAGAALLLLVSLPVLVVAVVAIRFDSSGPAVFAQVRLGSGGRRFKLYKLRTMRPESDESIHQAYVEALIQGTAAPSGGMFKLVFDPRVTRVGRWLRRLSIDELPQLWNVLRGDMSLVGPRPPLPREAECYDAQTWQRLLVKPGLTGLWQVSGRCELTFHEMVALDLRYVRSWSPWLELKILLRTPAAILSGRGGA